MKKSYNETIMDDITACHCMYDHNLYNRRIGLAHNPCYSRHTIQHSLILRKLAAICSVPPITIAPVVVTSFVTPIIMTPVIVASVFTPIVIAVPVLVTSATVAVVSVVPRVTAIVRARVVGTFVYTNMLMRLYTTLQEVA